MVAFELLRVWSAHCELGKTAYPLGTSISVFYLELSSKALTVKHRAAGLFNICPYYHRATDGDVFSMSAGRLLHRILTHYKQLAKGDLLSGIVPAYAMLIQLANSTTPVVTHVNSMSVKVKGQVALGSFGTSHLMVCWVLTSFLSFCHLTRDCGGHLFTLFFLPDDLWLLEIWGGFSLRLKENPCFTARIESRISGQNEERRIFDENGSSVIRVGLCGGGRTCPGEGTAMTWIPPNHAPSHLYVIISSQSRENIYRKHSSCTFAGSLKGAAWGDSLSHLTHPIPSIYLSLYIYPHFADLSTELCGIHAYAYPIWWFSTCSYIRVCMYAIGISLSPMNPSGSPTIGWLLFSFFLVVIL